jgi:surface protein
MARMFDSYGRDSYLQELDIQDWDTSNVADFRYMFRNCYNLKKSNAPRLVTKTAAKMGSMFSSVSKLETLNAQYWDTRNVTNMGSLFYTDAKLKNLNIKNPETGQIWDTGKVTSMTGMFEGTTALTNLDFLADLDTHNVQNMTDMFRGNGVQGTLDLSKWDVGNVMSDADLDRAMAGQDAVFAALSGNLGAFAEKNRSRNGPQQGFAPGLHYFHGHLQ